ncbi:MAG TPA: sigma-70 family RNA polymerase sigma factor [Polyangiaceae bacterium]|nr:sigma-70 family RNA polymerase sigma factor [Polyangiaceae bacterium]
MTALGLTAIATPSAASDVDCDEAEEFHVSQADAERIRAALENEHELVWRSLRRFGVDPTLVDDATQSVFVTFARRIRDVTVGRERSFLLGVCCRTAANLRRLVARRREVPGDPLVQEPDDELNPEELLDYKRRRRLLDLALEDLPTEQRTVFVLYELEGWTLPELAESLQLPLGTVTSRLRRARARFERWVLQHDGGVR